MIRFALHPRWWAWHLALVAVLVSFGWLGWWQLQAFTDNAPPQRPTRQAPADLDAVTGPGGRLGPAQVGRAVRATGRWDARGQLLVPDRDRGGRRGALVVTPLRTGRGVLPVVRGWVPAPGRATAPAPPDGQVTVVAVLQPSETSADATSAVGSLPPGQVPYVATVTVLSALDYGAAELYDGYAVLRSQAPPDPRAPALVEPRDPAGQGGVGRWRNLAYGLQWWVFAAAAVFFWASVLRRSAREQAAGGEPPAPPVAPSRTT